MHRRVHRPAPSKMLIRNRRGGNEWGNIPVEKKNRLSREKEGESKRDGQVRFGGMKKDLRW